MADKKITELPLIFSGDITSNDVLPIVDVDLDITNRIELDQLKSYINSGQTDTYITGGTFDIYSGVTTFTNPFYSANYAVGITAQGLATGDYYLLTNKTINGFNVAFKNSSGTGVSKTFDYLAKGY